MARTSNAAVCSGSCSLEGPKESNRSETDGRRETEASNDARVFDDTDTSQEWMDTDDHYDFGYNEYGIEECFGE